MCARWHRGYAYLVSDRFMIGHLSLLPPITTGSYSFTMGYKNKMAKK